MTDTNTAEREAIIRVAVAAMPHTNPLVADDLLGGFTMHTEADDIVAIFQAGRASLAVRAHNIVALSQLPPPAHNERVYGGHGNEIVHSYYTEHQMREYARQEVFRAEEAWQARASLAASAGSEPVAPDWWRKRADEIEAQVAATGSTEAMRCYTDMRTLLQAAAHPYPPEGMAGWMPIATAPKGNPLKPGPRFLLFVKGVGAALGHVYDDGCGGFFANADGYSGNWEITHWMPLPPAPPLPASEAKEL